jgi:hypothetical protein
MPKKKIAYFQARKDIVGFKGMFIFQIYHNHILVISRYLHLIIVFSKYELIKIKNIVLYKRKSLYYLKCMKKGKYLNEPNVI